MNRRAFVTGLGAVLAAPRGAGAQQGRVYRVGVIHQGGPYSDFIGGLRDGLKDLGLEERKQVVLVVRDARGDLNAVRTAARELEADKVDLICTVATSVTVAAKQATQRVPIVFYAGTDPVAAGLVKSFRKPGGRLTGIHSQTTDLTSKRLELLKEMIPTLRRVVTLYDPDNPSAQQATKFARTAAQQLSLEVVEQHVGPVEELRTRLGRFPSGNGDAYFYIADAMVLSQTDVIIEATNVKRLPGMFGYKDAVIKGALASYGQLENYYVVGRVCAKHIQRVLVGADPSTMPVEQLDRTESCINLKTPRRSASPSRRRCCCALIRSSNEPPRIRDWSRSRRTRCATPRGSAAKEKSTHRLSGIWCARVRSGWSWRTAYRSSPRFSHLFEAFADGLRAVGYVDGQTVTVEWRFAEERYERLPESAAELVPLGVNVIYTPSDRAP